MTRLLQISAFFSELNAETKILRFALFHEFFDHMLKSATAQDLINVFNQLTSILMMSRITTVTSKVTNVRILSFTT